MEGGGGYFFKKRRKKGDRDNRRRIILIYSEQFGSKIKSAIIKVQIANGFQFTLHYVIAWLCIRKLLFYFPLFERKHCNGR